MKKIFLSRFKSIKPKLIVDSPKSIIKSVFDVLHEIEAMSRGGCGIGSYITYNMVKNKFPQAKIDIYYLYLGYNSSSYIQNEMAFKGEREPNSCSHACIKYDGEFMDWDGTVAYDYFSYKHIIPGGRREVNKFMLQSINNLDIWNPMFSRENAIPFIEKKLNISLEEIIKIK